MRPSTQPTAAEALPNAAPTTSDSTSATTVTSESELTRSTAWSTVSRLTTALPCPCSQSSSSLPRSPGAYSRMVDLITDHDDATGSTGQGSSAAPGTGNNCGSGTAGSGSGGGQHRIRQQRGERGRQLSSGWARLVQTSDLSRVKRSWPRARVSRQSALAIDVGPGAHVRFARADALDVPRCRWIRTPNPSGTRRTSGIRRDCSRASAPPWPAAASGRGPRVEADRNGR